MPVNGADIVRDVFDAFTRRDAARLIALSDPAGEFWPAGTAEQTGRTEPYRGHEGIREYLADLERAWDDFAIEPGELRVAGAGVVAFGTVRLRPAGAPDTAVVPVIWVFKLRGDRVMSARVVPSAAEATTALQAREAG